MVILQRSIAIAAQDAMTDTAPLDVTPLPAEDTARANWCRETASLIVGMIEDVPNGRPFALTYHKLVKLFDMLLDANYREISCRAARISVATLHNYLTRGEAARTEFENTGVFPEGNALGFLTLLETIEYCEANAEGSCVKDARKDSAITFLRVRYPGRYHPKSELMSDPENPFIVQPVQIYLPDNGRGPKLGKDIAADEDEDLEP